MYPKILIPTDGSACAEAAAREGLAVAKALGSSVTLLYRGRAADSILAEAAEV